MDLDEKGRKFEEDCKAANFLGVGRKFSMAAGMRKGVPHITFLFTVREPDIEEERISQHSIVFPILDERQAESLIAFGEHMVRAVQALRSAREKPTLQ